MTRARLSPLAFDGDEIDALLLGLRFVARALPDDALGAAAEGALDRIEATLPPGRSAADVERLVGGTVTGEAAALAANRAAIGAEEALDLAYRDKGGAETRRRVWPVAVGDFAAAEVLTAWCELRGDFRHFRLDRIVRIAPTGRPMGRRHRTLLADWRLQEIDEWRD